MSGIWAGRIMTDLIGHLEMLDMLVRHPGTRAGTEAGAAFNLIKLGCHNPRQSERERERERKCVVVDHENRLRCRQSRRIAVNWNVPLGLSRAAASWALATNWGSAASGQRRQRHRRQPPRLRGQLKQHRTLTCLHVCACLLGIAM